MKEIDLCASMVSAETERRMTRTMKDFLPLSAIRSRSCQSVLDCVVIAGVRPLARGRTLWERWMMLQALLPIRRSNSRFEWMP